MRNRIALTGVGAALALSGGLVAVFQAPTSSAPPKPKASLAPAVSYVRGHQCPPGLTHAQCKTRFPAVKEGR